MLRYFVYAVDELKYNSGELLQKSSRLRNELSSGTLNPTMSNFPIPAMLIWINYTQHLRRWLNDQQAFESNCRPTGGGDSQYRYRGGQKLGSRGLGL